MHFRLATLVTPLFVLAFVPVALAQPSEDEAKPDAPAASSASADQAPAEAPKTEKPAAPADPSGSWKWDYTFNDNTAEFSVKLESDGKKIAGKYTAFGQTTDIEDGVLDKDDLSFVSRREFNGQKFEVKFKGKVEPNDIRGTVNVDFNNGPQEFEWHATRFVDLADVVGQWTLKLETPNGVIEPRLTITRDGDALKGEYESVFGKREPKNLALKDGELSWEISGDGQGGPFKVVYKGQPRGNKIAGTNEFDFNGNTGTMEFTGTRTPPKEEGAKGDQAAAPNEQRRQSDAQRDDD